MTNEERQQLHAMGMPIFLTLLEMKREELLEKIKSIAAGRINEVFFTDCVVTKTWRDDEPHSISIYYYAGKETISIDPTGITWNPKYTKGLNLAQFNQHFVL